MPSGGTHGAANQSGAATNGGADQGGGSSAAPSGGESAGSSGSAQGMNATSGAAGGGAAGSSGDAASGGPQPGIAFGQLLGAAGATANTVVPSPPISSPPAPSPIGSGTTSVAPGPTSAAGGTSPTTPTASSAGAPPSTTTGPSGGATQPRPPPKDGAASSRDRPGRGGAPPLPPPRPSPSGTPTPPAPTDTAARARDPLRTLPLARLAALYEAVDWNRWRADTELLRKTPSAIDGFDAARRANLAAGARVAAEFAAVRDRAREQMATMKASVDEQRRLHEARVAEMDRNALLGRIGSIGLMGTQGLLAVMHGALAIGASAGFAPALGLSGALQTGESLGQLPQKIGELHPGEAWTAFDTIRRHPPRAMDTRSTAAGGGDGGGTGEEAKSPLETVNDFVETGHEVADTVWGAPRTFGVTRFGETPKIFEAAEKVTAFGVGVQKSRETWELLDRHEFGKAYTTGHAAVEKFAKVFTEYGDNVESTFKFIDSLAEEANGTTPPRLAHRLRTIGHGVAIGDTLVPGASDASQALFASAATAEAWDEYRTFRDMGSVDPAAPALERQNRLYRRYDEMVKQLDGLGPIDGVRAGGSP